MKHVGENVDNSIYGKTKVEVPFLKAEHGELKEIGRVIISEKADPRWMDPDGCLIFQSTLPAWGATPVRFPAFRQFPYFNPRSSHGERPFAAQVVQTR